MRKTFSSASALLLASACVAGVPDEPDAGAGGWDFGTSSSSGKASSATHAVGVASSSGSGCDAGVEGGVEGGDGGCATCAEVLHAVHDPTRLCPGPDAFPAWASYVNCGCQVGGSCASDCAAGGWCRGIVPSFTCWTPPDNQCAACLAVKGGTGCGDQAALCEWN